VAKGDLILPDPDDYGPYIRVEYFPLNASESFAPGEPVYLNSDGEVQESGDDPTVVTFLGVAITSGDTARSSDPVGSFVRRIGQYQITGDGFTPTTSDMVAVAVCMPGASIKCRNFATDGAGTAATPTQANAIGETAGFTLDGSGNYSIDTGVTAAREMLQIVEVLDDNGQNIVFSGGTGTQVRAIVVENQFTVTPS